MNLLDTKKGSFSESELAKRQDARDLLMIFDGLLNQTQITVLDLRYCYFDKGLQTFDTVAKYMRDNLNTYITAEGARQSHNSAMKRLKKFGKL